MTYDVPNGSIEKNNGKWRGRLRWREVAEDGTPGPWNQLTKAFDVRSYPDPPHTPKDKRDTRGSALASKELAKWREQVIADLNKPKDEPKPEAPQETQSVGAWVEWCVETQAKGGSVDKSTTRGYKQQVRQIKEAFGDVALPDLTTNAIKNWESGLLEQGISPVGVRKAHVVLKTAMQDAVDDGLIDKTPFTRKTKPPKVVQKTPNALDQEDYDKAIELLQGGRHTVVETAALITLFTGMRREEVAALRWCDVDLERRVILVTNAVGIAEGGSYIKGTKRDKPPRPVPIRDGLVEVLKTREGQQRAEIERLNKKLSDDGKLTIESAFKFTNKLYVCGGVDGGYANPDTLSRKLKPLADSVLPIGNQGEPLSFLSLRHSFATELVREGVDAVTGSQILGNTPNVFSKYYVSTSEKVKRDVFEQMDAAQAERAEERKKKAEESGEVMTLDRTGTGE